MITVIKMSVTTTIIAISIIVVRNKNRNNNNEKLKNRHVNDSLVMAIGSRVKPECPKAAP